jgi:outer membrane beta-barrel protein
MNRPSTTLARRLGAAAFLAAATTLVIVATSAFAQDDPGPAGAAPSDSLAPPAEPAPPASAEAATPRASLNAPLTIYHRKVKLTESDDNVVRSGPGDSFSIVGVHKKGATFTVIAKSADWYNVRLSDSETGWIHASLCTEYDDLSDLEFKPNPKLFSRTGSFVLSGYAGAYAFDRKSNSFVAGGRVGYYVLEFLQAEGGVSWTHVHRPAEIVESLFGLTLEAEDFHMLFYHLNLTLEVLPGRQMVPYVTGGAGSSIMRGDTEIAYNFGAGTMLYISRNTAVRWEVRDYMFETGPDDARVLNHNVEFSIGTSVLF